MFRMNIRRLGMMRGGGYRELIGIDLSTNTVKIAHVKSGSGKSQVAGLLSRDITGLSDDEISKLISNCVSELKALNPRVIDVIPSNMVITKNVEIPSTDHREIKEIVNLQAGRHTPYSREEIIVDYVDIDVYKHNYTKILLVIVARKAIKRHFDILNKAGIKLEKVLFAPEGLVRPVSKILKLETSGPPVCIVHVDEEFSDFGVIFRNKIAFIRSISIGVRHLTTEGEEYWTRFAEEVRRSFETYQSEDIEKIPDSLILTGAVEELKTLDAVLNQAVHLPVKVVPYLQNLPFSKEALEVASSSKRLSFLNVVSPVIALEEMKMDFIPEDIKLRRSLEDRGRDLIKTGVLLLSVFVLIFLILLSDIYIKSAYLKTLNMKYQPLKLETEKLEKDFIRASTVKDYLIKRGYSLEVLTELHSIAPADVELDDIRFEEQSKFSIRGTARSTSTIFSFVDNIEKSKYFKEAKTRYTTKRREGSRDVTDFEINCLLEKEPGR